MFPLKAAAKPQTAAEHETMSLSGDFFLEPGAARISTTAEARIVAGNAYILTHISVSSNF